MSKIQHTKQQKQLGTIEEEIKESKTIADVLEETSKAVVGISKLQEILFF